MSNLRALPSAGRPFRLLTVLDKMIVKELFLTVGGVLTVLVVIIVSRKFIRVLAQAIEGNIANETVLTLLGLKIVLAANAFLPASLFMAVLMVLGRMYREQEMAAIASAGGSVFTIYRAVFLLVVPLSLAGVALSMLAAPWAEAMSEKLMHQDRQDADIRGISAGRFSEYSDGELIFYTENVDKDGRMHKVFVQNKQGERTGVVNAETGRLAFLPGGLYLILENGERVMGQPGNRDFTIEKFGEYAVLVEKKTTELVLGREAVATEDLWSSRETRDVAELQDRLNTPSGVILLAFLGVPLARLSPRGGIYGSMMVAFGIYFVYGNLQRVNHSWVVGGKVPGWLGYFWVDALLLTVGLLMLARLYGWRWLWETVRGKLA
ncbi:LPS export ABC transporter permease LptF [Methylomonas sp. MED-D]|uniref:Lipopolysaccharide export system permease protein LptF n=1 Tax=Methylomonas koyamae TaxID=702114 RepID=A0A177NX39_9GAMM|nr:MULTISPECIES: LPS export ABC transporter permease LptF [Methylomonas]NJA05970.1 LPS export ABC transporter permease LptF [Methylococcaceae bacterium WWC4]MDT4330593.1 LPS export ABC transporter permease LptF [Methylomonas sp. MV1]OAI22501.1 LPS export ABC transporter permease LptF [Methylomonas koyamae]OHX34961.1 LPS export ABC transporter permease LptF [Methylomonas sp. LWB]WGS86278.1 LPS export ABC transporter permease LptF [Methylomonas sp. UP202]